MYSNSNLSLTVLFGLFLLSLSSCHLFESTKVPAKEIKTASSWSEKDQSPSFESCEGLNPEDQVSCFEEMIAFTVLDYINENPWVASENIDEEVVLNLLIDKEGLIWVGNRTGLDVYASSKERFVRAPIPGQSNVSHIADDPSGRTWVSSNQTLFCY